MPSIKGFKNSDLMSSREDPADPINKFIYKEKSPSSLTALATPGSASRSGPSAAHGQASLCCAASATAGGVPPLVSTTVLSFPKVPARPRLQTPGGYRWTTGTGS